MYTRICLLWLFLASSAVGGEISVSYQVLKERGALSRRADLLFNCSSSNRAGNYSLTVKPFSSGIEVKLSFRGKGLEVVQTLREGQSILGGTLEVVDPLTGDVVGSSSVSFNRGKVRLKGLREGFIYRLTYRLSDSSKEKHLVPPLVRLDGGSGERVLKFKVPIFFAPGSFSLDSKAKFTLDALKGLKEVCDISVVGYSDSTKIVRAKVPSNEELARLRALSVRNYLEKE